MPRKFQFRVKYSNSRHYIYATKFSDFPWHYFEEQDSILSQHDSLPYGLEYIIQNHHEMGTIELNLSDEQAQNYYRNGSFVFKNYRLKTFEEIRGRSADPIKRRVVRSLHSDNITFSSGDTNPILFLAEFEKCEDICTDQDKIEKIRHFVDDEDKPEFSQLQFTSDWPTIEKAFLIKYSMPFIKNKKKNMDIVFGEEPSLRSFMKRKFESFAKFTTLTIINQMEIILNELPDEVAQFFMVNKKFNCTKDDILDFCDRIEDVVANYIKDNDTQDSKHTQNDPLQRMMPFNFNPDSTDESDESINEHQSPNSDVSVASTSRGRRGRGRGGASTGKIVKRGRPKKLKPIQEESSDGDDYDCLDQMSTSSKSSWSSHN